MQLRLVQSLLTPPRQAYISEGPGGGHYEILKDARYTSVACGIFDKGGGRVCYSLAVGWSLSLPPLSFFDILLSSV